MSVMIDRGRCESAGQSSLPGAGWSRRARRDGPRWRAGRGRRDGGWAGGLSGVRAAVAAGARLARAVAG